MKGGAMRKLAVGDLAEQVKRVESAYNFEVRKEFVDLIGPFKQIAGLQDLRLADVPQEMERQFFYSRSFSSSQGLEARTKTLDEDQYHAKWQEQAKRLGWGVKEAKALMRESARRKYWTDLRSNAVEKIRGSAKSFFNDQRSLRPKIETPLEQKLKNCKEGKTCAHRHSH
jgi:hypothetical protein